MDQSSNATEQASGARRHQDPEAFCSDLEWLLIAGDSALGERGNLGGVIAQLERGGPSTGVPSTDLYSDQQVGWGKTVDGLVERHRWLAGAWGGLSRETRGTLASCYHALPAELRGDAISGSRSGAEAQLGRYAVLAFQLTDSPGELLEACRQPGKGKNGRTIARALRKARDAAVAAHALWRAAKDEARHPRSRGERRAVLPAFDPMKADAT
jgi:hypothetical protein